MNFKKYKSEHKSDYSLNREDFKKRYKTRDFLKDFYPEDMIERVLRFLVFFLLIFSAVNSYLRSVRLINCGNITTETRSLFLLKLLIFAKNIIKNKLQRNIREGMKNEREYWKYKQKSEYIN